MIYYQVYMKTDCPFCVKALDILDEHDKMFVVTVLDDAPKEVIEELKEQCKHDTVPIILEIDSKQAIRLIGGYTELKQEFNKADAKFIKHPRLEDMSEEERQEDEDYWTNHGQGD